MLREYHRIIVHPKWKGTHEAHQDPPWLRTAPPKPTLLELWQLGAVPTALGSLLRAHCPLMKENPHLTLPDSSEPFPRALTLSPESRSQPCLSAPCEELQGLESSLSLLCSVLNKPQELSCSSHILSFRSFPIFTALLWMSSGIFMSHIVAHKHAHCAQGEAAPEQSRTFPSLIWQC